MYIRRAVGRTRIIVAALFVFSGALVGTSDAAAQDWKRANMVGKNLALTEPYKLGPGDLISIFVWRQPEISQSASVGPDGMFGFPLIGEIDAAGLTLLELQEQVQKRLDRQLSNVQVTATLKEVRSYRVYVTGEVTKPGMFELDGAITVVQGIAMAGGFTAFATRKSIIVYNQFVDRDRRIKFDYDQFVAGDSDVIDIVLLPGDTVIVP